MHLQKCVKHHVEMGFAALNITPFCDMFNILRCTRQPCKVVKFELYLKNSHVHVFAPYYYGWLIKYTSDPFQIHKFWICPNDIN
jgi:hypothetical protein